MVQTTEATHEHTWALCALAPLQCGMCQAQQQPPTWDGPEMKREGRQIRQQAVDQFLQCQKNWISAAWRKQDISPQKGKMKMSRRQHNHLHPNFTSTTIYKYELWVKCAKQGKTVYNLSQLFSTLRGERSGLKAEATAKMIGCTTNPLCGVPIPFPWWYSNHVGANPSVCQNHSKE